MYILFREREEEQEAMRLMGNVQQVNDQLQITGAEGW